MTILSHNLFLAIRPPRPVKAEARRLRDELCRHARLTGREISDDSLHISLCPFGDCEEVPDELVARAAAALAKVTMPPFVVSLNQVLGWNGKSGQQPLVLTGDDGVIGIEMLRGQIRACLSEVGLVAPSKSCRIPHMTLLYGNVAGFRRIIEPLQWSVREFVLVDSHFRENRHLVLFRQPLSEAPPPVG